MIDNKTIQQIAKLARIKLTGKEEEKMQGELSSILKYIELLNRVDTEGVEPLYQTTGLLNSVRGDEYREDFEIGGELHDKLVGQAPGKGGRAIKVKSILNK